MLAIVIIVRKIGALSSPCGYSLLIAVITAVASWMIAITKGSHFFYFLPKLLQWHHLLPYDYIITLHRVICNTFL